MGTEFFNAGCPMDHDQFFKHLMKLFLRQFFELFYPEWIGKLDFEKAEWLEQEVFPDPPKGEKRVVDILVKVPWIVTDDTQEAPKDWLVLVHIEVESRDSVADYPKRMYEYYTDLSRKHDLEVLPIAIFLSVGLDGLDSGVYRRGVPGRKTLTFEYDYVGLPALEGVKYLQGDNMLGVAWSCVMRMAKGQRGEAAAEAIRIIEASPLTPQQKVALMEFVDSYSPMEVQEKRDFNELFLNPKMENTMQFRKSWMQEARDEGRNEGRTEGRTEGLELGKRQLLERQLEARFSRPLDESVKRRLEAMSANRLETLAVQLFSANSLKELGLED